MIMKKVFLLLFTLLAITGACKAHNLEPLHVDGRYLKNSKGDIVTLHGYMAVLDPWFQAEEYRWEGYDVATCLKNKKAAINRLLESDWKIDYVRFGLDAYWFSDDYTDQAGTVDFVRFKKYFEELFLPLIDYYHEKGIYTLLWLQQGTPETIEMGDKNHELVLSMWDYISNHSSIKNNPGVMFELANEPVKFNCHQGESYDGYWGLINNVSSAFREVRDYWQPVVDKIRSHCDNIIYIPGMLYESDHAGFTDYPIQGDNIGYAVHWYPGWWGNMRKDWEDHVFPIAYKAPIIITENAWAPYNNYLQGNAEASTSKFGKPLKSIVDELGNVSWNCYEPDEEYYYYVISSTSSEKAVIANDPEACFKAMYQWWDEYEKTKVMPTSQLKAKTVSFNDFPKILKPGQKSLAKIKAEFANGMTWDISGDAEYTVADESILSIKHGVIWGLKEGTTNVTATYTDGTGQTFSRQFEVTCTLFPLTAEGFKPNLQLEGSFDETTGTFSAESACVGGWSFADGLDMSSYKYVVLQLNQQQQCWAMVRIWDDSNVWSENEAWNDNKGDIGFDFNDATELVIDLQSLHKKGGEPMDLSHIYHIGIWINGSIGSISIKRVFLSNDGVTLSYQEPTRVYADNKVMYYGDKVPELTFSILGIPIDGTPTLSTSASSTSLIGTYPITIERGTISNDQVNYIDGTLTILKRPMVSLEYEPNEFGFETAANAVKNMKIGWNLWNTLDAHLEHAEWFNPEGWWSWETCWSNPVTKAELMKMMRKAGFNAIRVPVTWYPHTDSDGSIDPAWMARVHEVVDYVIDQGMYCLLNTHHDTEYGWDEATQTITRQQFLMADADNYRDKKVWYENLWRQIAEEFKDYDQHLLFEAYNEMTDKYGAWGRPAWWAGEEHAQQAYKAINDYAQSFVNVVRSTGGNNRERNLVVNTYSACTGPGEWNEESLRQMDIPEDVTGNHIIFGIHYYGDTDENSVDGLISNVLNCISSRGVPAIISEWGGYCENDNDYEDSHGYFVKHAKANRITTFLWGGISSYLNRSLPAFDGKENAKNLLNAYYGDDYEPQLLTKDDYAYSSCKLTFTNLWAQFRLCSKELNLDDYKGIRLIMENPNDIHLLINGDSEGQQQREVIFSSSITIDFDKTILGSSVSNIELQNMKDGKNETTIYHVYLIKNDETEEKVVDEDLSDVWGCNVEKIYKRKQFVHTVNFDYRWAELNLFYDDVPLKLKNYKGIRLELEKPLNDFHVTIIGDEEQNVDYVGLNGTSTTIIFNTDIFKKEINRVTLQREIDGQGEAKVISAWLIRQDGTEEYSDLSPFHGCEITNVEKYVPISKGDINGDGTVNTADIVEVVKYIMGSPSDCFDKKAADVNGDGVINAADIVNIVNMIVGN